MIQRSERCCRRDSEKAVTSPFSIGNKIYRVKYKFRYNGNTKKIFAKTKLQVKKGGIWVRTRADQIMTGIAGSIRTPSGDCLCAYPVSLGIGSIYRAGKSVDRKRYSHDKKFRVMQGGLVSTHFVKIKGQTVTLQLSLWSHKCKCSEKKHGFVIDDLEKASKPLVFSEPT